MDKKIYREALLEAASEAKKYAKVMNRGKSFNGFHEIDFYNGAFAVIEIIKKKQNGKKK